MYMQAAVIDFIQCSVSLLPASWFF
jgi:hypothetical protein